MNRKKFRRGPRSILDYPREQQVFQFTAAHIAPQAEDVRTGLPDQKRLHAIPVPARTVYLLWLFSCEAGLNGLEKFVLDNLGCYSREVHTALREVGAVELAQRLEVAIALARHTCAEFKWLPDTTWFERFAPVSHYATLHALDADGTYDMVSKLTATVVAYIRAHHCTLFQG